jgi:SEC-C motif-containing protein
MRARFSAFAVGAAEYLRATWHPSTRPAALELDRDVRWLRLEILDRVSGGPLDREGVIEFEAFYAGGSQRERSSFVREGGRWLYVSESAPDARSILSPR